MSIPEFLARYIQLEQGTVLSAEGAVIGEHDGAALYTIGQRHGFRIHETPPHPLYVVAIDAAANTITVDNEPQRAARNEASLHRLHWSGPSYDEKKLFAQTRYREQAVLVQMIGPRIHFESPHVVTPGQSIVLYHNDVCVGGGIASSIHTDA